MVKTPIGLTEGRQAMSDPYRSEDQVVKLQAENEKLQKEKDELMARFGLLKKWPAFLFFGLMIGMVAFGSFWAGRSVSPANLERTRISSYDYYRTPAACPAPPVCADGVDEHVLGMNKVVSGTLGSWDTGPISEDWRFSARAGDEVVFRMKRKSGGLDPVLILADTRGNILAGDNDSSSGVDAKLSYRFALSGIYILRCHGTGGSYGTPHAGSYTLSATRARTP